MKILRGFTSTSEKDNESSFLLFSSAVEANPTTRSLVGFTLLETIITIAIISIIMIAITDSVRFFYRANTSSLEQSYQIDSARKGVSFLVRDLREASNGDNGTYPISEIGTSTITFFSDTDRDVSVEKITYELNGTILTRHVVDSSGNPPAYTSAGATSTVSIYVRNIEEEADLFTYYDRDGAVISDLQNIGDVRSVTINLVVNIQPIRAPNEFTLRSSATLRNLRDE